jgi:hypothetical protein
MVMCDDAAAATVVRNLPLVDLSRAWPLLVSGCCAAICAIRILSYISSTDRIRHAPLHFLIQDVEYLPLALADGGDGVGCEAHQKLTCLQFPCEHVVFILNLSW